MDQNNLDKLFQEKLEDFSSIPDEQVWKRIETSLNKKRKKRVIPIWWGIAGAAAILIFALLLFNPFAIDEGLNQNPLSDSDKKDSSIEKIESPSETNEILNQPDNGKQVADTEENNFDSQQEEAISKNKSIVPKKRMANPRTDNQLATTTAKSAKNVEYEEGKDNKTTKTDEIDFETEPNASQSELAVVVTENYNSEEKNLEGTKNKQTELDSKADDEKKSIYEAIEEQLLEDETQVAENTLNKWSVGPSVAPVYFNSIGEGSSIHSNFNENRKTGKINLSYGIAVAYEVNRKLKIRSGVHRVNMGYGTDDILFSSSVEESTNAMIDNIDYNLTSRSLLVESRKKSAAENSNADAFASQELSANNSPALDGSMVQQLGYFEVPFELNYALIDKKFGVNLIGGVSSLFLVDNSVALESQDGFVTEMGEANNVNSVNFSTNVGLGLNYQFSDKIQLNVEPIFKYQLNTFSESAGNFNPYTIGVYSGLNFRF